METPVAQRRPVTGTLHGETVVDDYSWLRNPADPAVMAYLEAENEFAQAATSHLADLRQRIFEEIKSRVRETDRSAPARKGKWWYCRRTEEGRQYSVYLRWPHPAPDEPEQVILDQNVVAEGKAFCDIAVFSVSPDQNLLAYSVDHSGHEDFTLRFRRLDTGEDFSDCLTSTYYGGAW
ncbi:MAG: oligopeptidase B, partial [Acidimicrobiia bacterium]|nr:oligopeptidase B [Acidimicrobiia bacterium]